MSARSVQKDARERIGREVARRVGTRRWDMWFDRTTEFKVKGSHLRIEADSRFVADWIERHFREAIQTAAKDELGDTASIELAVRKLAPVRKEPTESMAADRRPIHNQKQEPTTASSMLSIL